MKKLSMFLLSALLILGVSSIVFAESSATTFSGNNYQEQQVFTKFYNNSGGAIQSNCVVILDVTGTAGSTLGSYITTSASSGSPYIIGVTDEVIATGSVGKVCIRGPHRVAYTTAPSAGDTATNGTSNNYAVTGTSTSNKYGYLGRALAVTASTDSQYGSAIWWTWIEPTVQ